MHVSLILDGPFLLHGIFGTIHVLDACWSPGKEGPRSFPSTLRCS